jgi:hypothetical protein
VLTSILSTHITCPLSTENPPVTDQFSSVKEGTVSALRLEKIVVYMLIGRKLRKKPNLYTEVRMVFLMLLINLREERIEDLEIPERL